MKLLIVSSSYPLNRDEIHYSFVFDEAVRLHKRGIEINVATSRFGKDATVEGIYVHNISRIFKLSSLTFTAKSISKYFSCACFNTRVIGQVSVFGENIARIAKSCDVNVVHAHFAYPEGFASKLATKAVKKPFIVTLHGHDIITEPSIGYGIRLTKSYDNLVRSVLRTADKVIVASKYVYQKTLRAGCPDNRLVYIPNGVDLTRFNNFTDNSYIRNKLGIQNRPMVFTLGNHVPKSGIEYLIKSIPIVLSKKPDAIFVIGGDGPLRNMYQKLAKDLNVDRNVVFTGRISHTELPFYYAACDIFVIPSVIEAFGLVTVEAMACGRPVVGTNVGGIPDIIEEGINGFLVNAKDHVAIAEKVQFLLKNPKLRKEMGYEGRRLAEEKFDVKKRIDKVLTVYSELLQNNETAFDRFRSFKETRCKS